jgi:XTP/dITP diphosphohydrolase
VRVVVASRNRHKLREIGVLLAEAGLPWDLVSIDQVAPDCALLEEEPSFEGNALSKARQAAAASGLPALADDSGIEVDALHGAPGVYSARWSGEPCDDARNNQKMLRELAGRSHGKAHRPLPLCRRVRGSGARLGNRARGHLRGPPAGVCAGHGGIRLRPAVLVESLGRTMAEITLAEKNRLSHRAAAFRELAQALVELDLVR